MDRESVWGEHMMVLNDASGNVGLTYFRRKQV